MLPRWSGCVEEPAGWQISFRACLFLNNALNTKTTTKAKDYVLWDTLMQVIPPGAKRFLTSISRHTYARQSPVLMLAGSAVPMEDLV